MGPLCALSCVFMAYYGPQTSSRTSAGLVCLAAVAAAPHQVWGLVVVVQDGDVVRGVEGEERLGGVLQVEHVAVCTELPVHPQELRAAVGDRHLGQSGELKD